MSLKRSGLGRNLSALLNTSTSILPNITLAPKELRLSLDLLQPGKYQPRTAMDDNSLQELAVSIKQQGLLQPILVRSVEEGRYEIIAGERRWRASRLAGLTEIPALLRQVDDETAMAMALIENLQREDLNSMDQARAMARLNIEFELTHQQIAELLSKSRTAVSNYLRLLSLSEGVKRLLEYGDLDMGHARALLGLDEEKQLYVANIVVAKNLNVRETEKLVKRVNHVSINEQPHSSSSDLTTFSSGIEHLKQYLNTKVDLKQLKSGKGSLVIHYNSVQDLESVINQILKN